jgi:hypothetical protein
MGAVVGHRPQHVTPAAQAGEGGGDADTGRQAQQPRVLGGVLDEDLVGRVGVGPGGGGTRGDEQGEGERDERERPPGVGGKGWWARASMDFGK